MSNGGIKHLRCATRRRGTCLEGTTEVAIIGVRLISKVVGCDLLQDGFSLND